MSRSSTSSSQSAAPLPAKQAIKGQPKVKKVKRQPKRFRIPKDELAVIDTLKSRCADVGLAVKKSELVRAGLKLLDQLTHTDLQVALKRLQGGATALLEAVQLKATSTQPKATPRARKTVRPSTAKPAGAAVVVVKKPAPATAAPVVTTEAPQAAKATRRKPATKASNPAQPADTAPTAAAAPTINTKRPVAKGASKRSNAATTAPATPTTGSIVTPDTTA